MRQVVDAAIRRCLRDSIFQDADSDGYRSLKTTLCPPAERLDSIYALGILCTIYLIMVQAGPDMISPVLLEAAVNGIASIVDIKWLSAVTPITAKDLALLPASPTDSFPTHMAELHRLRMMTISRIETPVCYQYILMYTLVSCTTVIGSTEHGLYITRVVAENQRNSIHVRSLQYETGYSTSICRVQGILRWCRYLFIAGLTLILQSASHDMLCFLC
jgi:hypothetical protein